MKNFGELFQVADWKKEKHVPFIECANKVKLGEIFPLKITVGKDNPHPNTTEHHICWISLFFHPEGEQYAYQLAQCEFTAHGESVKGANEGPAYTHHSATVAAMIKKPGTIHAMSLCNIHGLWENSTEIKVS